MSIAAAARAAVAAIVAAEPDTAVTVVYGSQSATGLRVLTEKETEAGLLGQAGTTISTVRVDSSQIDEPARGAHITVDGTQVYVLSCRTSGGLRVIMVSDTQPVEGI